MWHTYMENPIKGLNIRRRNREAGEAGQGEAGGTGVKEQ